MTARRLKFTLTFTLILLLTQPQLYASDSNNPRAQVTTSSTTPAGDTVMAHGEVLNGSYVSVIDGFTLSECSISLADLWGVGKSISTRENTRFSGWQVSVDYSNRSGYNRRPDIGIKMLTYQIICSKNRGSVKMYPPGHNF